MKKRLRIILYIGVLVLSIAIQYSVMRYFTLLGVRPNLPLVAVVMLGYLAGSEKAVLSGFFVGLYQDAVSGKILGMYALFYLYFSLVASLFSKRNQTKNLPIAIVVTYVLTAIAAGCTYLFGYMIPIMRSGYGLSVGIIYATGRIIVPEAFLNAVFCVPYYFIFKTKKQKEGGESIHVA